MMLHYLTTPDTPLPKGKRQRPRYTMKSSMMRKHPVLKFFATGPLDRHKNPYKRWCRVCRVELPLTSRGVLELLSHYRPENHLIKEQRIRLELPGTPLFDRSENELFGLPLQEAKRIAKETYPIAPQLDACRLLVGQNKLPDLSSSASPSSDVLAQISILEQGLRYSGHVDSLVSIWNEMVQLSPSCEESFSYSWSKQGIFVSIYSQRKYITFSSFSRQYSHVYIFRELLNYSVTAISTSEVYSLSFQSTHTSTEVYVNFWSGNVYHQVCLGSGPRGFLVPKRL